MLGAIFLQGLLETEADKRMNVSEALEDAWLDEAWVREMYDKVVVRGELGIMPNV